MYHYLFYSGEITFLEPCDIQEKSPVEVLHCVRAQMENELLKREEEINPIKNAEISHEHKENGDDRKLSVTKEEKSIYFGFLRGLLFLIIERKI